MLIFATCSVVRFVSDCLVAHHDTLRYSGTFQLMSFEDSMKYKRLPVWLSEEFIVWKIAEIFKFWKSILTIMWQSIIYYISSIQMSWDRLQMLKNVDYINFIFSRNLTLFVDFEETYYFFHRPSFSNSSLYEPSRQWLGWRIAGGSKFWGSVTFTFVF